MRGIFQFITVYSIFLLLISCATRNDQSETPVRHKQEFEERFTKAYLRLVASETSPVFTNDFILADIMLDPNYPRRFSNYSGDISGRYIEVISMVGQPDDLAFLKDLVNKAIKLQKSDGRFGTETLDFKRDNITGEHMALLWGNGRLLVGLLAYYQRYQDNKVLEAAKKLGDFYLSTYDACATPENISKLANFGAMGIICFTQYIEGMIDLYKVTGQSDYINVCKKVYQILPPRGNQHAHGYLTTLRGVLKLYEITLEKDELNFVQERYNDIKNSQDYTIFGSVKEYFGKKGIRDEGCATADFIRLALHLYRLTGNHSYLYDAEKALFNALYFNQYSTGDFGHHVLTSKVLTVYDSEHLNTHSLSIDGVSSHYRMAAWWCCTMHGLRCLKDVSDQVVRVYNGDLYLDLFLETKISRAGYELRLTRVNNPDYPLFFELDIMESATSILSIRYPEWATKVDVYKNTALFETLKTGNYIRFPEKIKKNDKIGIGFKLSVLPVNEMSEKITTVDRDFSGYLYYGPFLMGIDDNTDPVYLAEPNNNILILKSIQEISRSQQINDLDSLLYLEATYHHAGFPSEIHTILRPVKQYTFEKRPTASIKFDFSSGKTIENNK